MTSLSKTERPHILQLDSRVHFHCLQNRQIHVTAIDAASCSFHLLSCHSRASVPGSHTLKNEQELFHLNLLLPGCTAPKLEMFDEQGPSSNPLGIKDALKMTYKNAKMTDSPVKSQYPQHSSNPRNTSSSSLHKLHDGHHTPTPNDIHLHLAELHVSISETFVS